MMVSNESLDLNLWHFAPREIMKVTAVFLIYLYLNTSIMFLTLFIVLSLSKKPSCLFLKHNVSETGFCLCLQANLETDTGVRR
jgi:hypothetical protein